MNPSTLLCSSNNMVAILDTNVMHNKSLSIPLPGVLCSTIMKILLICLAQLGSHGGVYFHCLLDFQCGRTHDDSAVHTVSVAQRL